jgi:hypothetical protein
MGSPSDPRLLVLHGLRLKGFGEPDDVAAIVGVDVDLVDKHLEQLQGDGFVLRRDGRLVGWALTADGRAEQERLLAAELDEAGARAVIDAAYRKFLGLNIDLLTVCTAWQMVDDTTLNDHSDASYDAGVIDRLVGLHGDLDPVLTDLEAALDRYGGFRPRLDIAVERVQGGDPDWFTKPLIDSYHTVWFQLHEDLLNTLGIERSQEASA